jgi:2-dehydro-3-deoxygluconokinase
MIYDIVTLGETMVRLTPPDNRRFEQAHQFDFYFGGSESNTAVGLARLGHKVAWLSRLPDHALGRRLAATLTAYGVDVSQVAWAGADERLGLYYLEEGAAPRGSQVIYDRRDSAASRMTPAMLPPPLFMPDRARHLHLTGITPALSPSAAATAARALELAKAADWTVSFDVNYRAKLWEYDQARSGCAPFIEGCDLLIMPLRDARRLFFLADHLAPDDALAALAERYPDKTIALTIGAEGAIAYGGGGIVRQAAFPVEARSRIGAGDAFAAGLLHGYLRDPEDLANALRWAAAAAALKLTIPGDIPLFTHDETAKLVRGHHLIDITR